MILHVPSATSSTRKPKPGFPEREQKMSNTTDKTNEPQSPDNPSQTAQILSEAQLLANQLNAQKSTGPRTEAGKARSSMNARRHGLTGQFYVMNNADRTAYETFEKSLLAALKPVGAYEHQLAVSIAQDHWRINRSRAIEFNTLGLGHEELKEDAIGDTPEVQAAITQTRTWHHEHPSLTNISLYETRVNRMIAKNEKRLAEIQQERKAAEATALEEAELLHCQAVMNGDTVLVDDTIEVNGFVFSRATLLARIQRKSDLASARYYQSVGWNRTARVPDHHRFPIPRPDQLRKAA
jgi:hypothetical protein